MNKFEQISVPPYVNTSGDRVWIQGLMLRGWVGVSWVWLLYSEVQCIMSNGYKESRGQKDTHL